LNDKAKYRLKFGIGKEPDVKMKEASRKFLVKKLNDADEVETESISQDSSRHYSTTCEALVRKTKKSPQRRLLLHQIGNSML
jgi:peptidyl-tRNA hydrolase